MKIFWWFKKIIVIGKMKDEVSVVAMEELFELKPKMYSRLVGDSSVHKKSRRMNKNVFVTMSYVYCKDPLLINKNLKYSMNRIQSKNHKIGTYEINKISYSCFDCKIDMMD